MTGTTVLVIYTNSLVNGDSTILDDADENADAGRFETNVISVRLGRSLSRDELLSDHSAMTDASKRLATAVTSTVQWKFLCVEGNTCYQILMMYTSFFKSVLRCVHNMSPFISSSGLSPGSRETEVQRAKVCLNCTEPSVARSSYWSLPIGRYLSDNRCKGSVIILYCLCQLELPAPYRPRLT